MSFRARLMPAVLCQAATGRGRSRLPASGTESLSSVISSPDGSCRSTGSAATVPARTTTLTITIAPPFSSATTVAPASDIFGSGDPDLRFSGPEHALTTLGCGGNDQDVRGGPRHHGCGYVHGRPSD